MDLVALTQAITSTLVPVLPYLFKVGEKAAEEAGKRIGGDTWEWAKDLWGRLRPKVEAKPAALEAAQDAAHTPEDEDVQAMLRVQLRKLLADDPVLSEELNQWCERAKAAGVIAVASGERSVAIGRDVSGSVIITGHTHGDVVTGDKVTHVHEAAIPIATALNQLPPPSSDFTGRANELAELTARLDQSEITIFCFHGLGGVGKTALALKLADDLKTRYRDAQLYLDLKGASRKPLAVTEALAHVIRAYHPTTKLPEAEAELRGLYRSVLKDQRALLLMDNAADVEQVEPLIPPAGCALLITSRSHFTLPGMFSQNLEALSSEDARELLLRIAPRIGNTADQIAALCGYLPLALRLAGSALATRVNISPEDYLRRLQDVQRRLDMIEASLNLSYELLSEQSQKLWRLLAVFPDSFVEAAAAAVWETDRDHAQEALGELIAASMVEWNQSARRYRLHDLARLFAGSRLGIEERADGQRLHATHYNTGLEAADNLYLEGGASVRAGLMLLDLEWKNIEAGQAWAEAQAGGNDQAAELCISYPIAGAWILNLRQHPRERIRWLEVALGAARRLKQRGREGEALRSLGIAYDALGETRRAIEFHEQALIIVREIGDRLGESAALGSLGTAYAALGEIRRAIEFYEQALNIAREMGDRRGEGAAVGNLGITYLYLGETKPAIEYFERSLLIDREIGDPRGECNALNNLGLVYANLGEAERAIEFYEQGLNIAREIGDLRAQGGALNNLGNAYLDSGETERAIEFYQERLKIARETGDRRGEGNALSGLGNAYEDLGATERAIDLYEQRLEIARETGDRRAEGYALFNRGEALDVLGERAQAIAGAEEALTILEQIEDPRAAQVREQLAEWQAAPG